MTSYQKLKAKISRLEKDINVLVFNPDSIQAALIKARKEAVKDIVESGMFGSRNSKGNGLIEQIDNQTSGIYLNIKRNH